MDNWRDKILNEFVPNLSQLTIVADPDALLTEEKLSLELNERGFDLIEYNDAIEFRYVYESNYRSIWDQEKKTDLIVILRLKNLDIESLPFDLLTAGRKLSFNLGDIFPNLSYPVIEVLDSSHLDKLFSAQQKFNPNRMGDNETKDFILKNVFGIDVSLINNEVDLLRFLLRIHYNASTIPFKLCERLVQKLKENNQFKLWPLEKILPDSVSFYAFLQERWPIFLQHLANITDTKDTLTLSGPNLLPFDHNDIKVYIDNLFIEGKLCPVNIADFDINENNLKDYSWITTGLTNTGNNTEVRITKLLELIQTECPKAESRYPEWQTFALKWAELTALIYNNSETQSEEMFLNLGKHINNVFAEWLISNYSSLINLPPANPVMLHHIPKRLSRVFEGSSNARIAFIVLDGLSLAQWLTIDQLLKEQTKNILIRESAVFAWIPTLTSVSRQAIFAGKAPIYFPNSLTTTNNEPALWQQFWESYGLSKINLAYKKGLGDGDPIKEIEDVFNPGQTKVIGLVIDKIDKIMHGMQLGSAGMHNQIKQWCDKKYLSILIEYLLENNYQIWLTSDHGNIECTGKGRPSEGVIAETRGERVRIYPTAELRSKVGDLCKYTVNWPANGLPDNYYPLVIPGREAFVKEGENIVGHGGISIEEVLVPFVQIERRLQDE